MPATAALPFPQIFSAYLKGPVSTGMQGNRLRFFANPLSPTQVRRVFGLLNENLLPFVKRVNIPVPKDSISGLKKNYSEKLGKAILNGSVDLNSSRSKAYPSASRIGLIHFLQSDELRTWVERATGFQLENDPGMQVLCYRHGDYVSPHNDHHPEEPHLRNGYIDVHFMFSNTSVESQQLVYEKDFHLNQSVSIALPSSIAIYHLPFWHYTTPLTAKKGKELTARRWLVMASYVIKKPTRS